MGVEHQTRLAGQRKPRRNGCRRRKNEDKRVNPWKVRAQVGEPFIDHLVCTNGRKEILVKETDFVGFLCCCGPDSRGSRRASSLEERINLGSINQHRRGSAVSHFSRWSKWLHNGQLAMFAAAGQDKVYGSSPPSISSFSTGSNLPGGISNSSQASPP
jgi:hypothetical protein